MRGRAWSRGALLLALAAGGGCVVAPADWAGQLCDDLHACFDGRVCVEGTCVTPGAGDAGDAGAVDASTDAGGPGDGGTDGGLTDAGATDAGATDAGATDAGVTDAGATDAGVTDAGATCVAWRQTRDGFTGTRVKPGALLSIDPTMGHRVTAHLPSAANASDEAVAEVSPPGAPALGPEGQLEGRFFVPTGTRLDGLVPFVTLWAAPGPLVELGFDNGWELAAFTAAGVLRATAISQPRSTQRYDPGTPHVVRVSWKAGAYRRVYVDGALVFEDLLSPVAGLQATPTSLDIGFTRYEGGGSDPMDMTLSDFVLCNVANGAIQ